jgi:hypothetical protein
LNLNSGNYKLTNNSIEAVNGNGIAANAAYGVQAIGNSIKLNGNTTNGIELTGCDDAIVSCNNIAGRYPLVGYNNRGIYTAHSSNNILNCNHVDSTYLGVYFEGVCTGTKMRGTEINRHFEGLRLYTNAVIDTQAHSGNLWFGPFSTGGYGANNLNNSSPFNLSLSAFLIDFSYGGAFIPSIPVNNTGWINPDVGTEFDCTNILLCADESNERNAATKLQLTIAEDSLETTEFSDETKIIAKNYLYKDVKENDSLANANFLLTSFLNANENTVIGQLYDVNKAMKEANEISEAENLNLNILNLLIDSIIAGIYHLDSLAFVDSTINIFNQRDSLIQQLNSNLQIKTDLFNQTSALKEQSLVNIRILSNSIIINNTPNELEKEMNDIEIAYQTGGLLVLQSRYNDVLNIAVQCPHVGGKAVYKARSFIALLNDTIEYDDVVACTEAGYRRVANNNEQLKEETRGNIKIVPNPANDKVTLKLSDDMNGICKILFYDVVGKEIFSKKLDCNQKIHSFDIKNLSEGMYSVKVKQTTHQSELFKLIIVR